MMDCLSSHLCSVLQQQLVEDGGMSALNPSLQGANGLIAKAVEESLGRCVGCGYVGVETAEMKTMGGVVG